jgi:glycosyltransferase involved in cell wall biosynthesis
VALLLRAAGVPVLEFGKATPISALYRLPLFLRGIEAWNPTLVHGWMYHGNLAALVAGRRLGLPVVWGIRQSLGESTHDKWLTRRVIRAGAWLSLHAAAIVYNSATARWQHESRGYAAERGIVIPNGFDTGQLRADEALRASTRAELGVADDAPVVAQVARYHQVKDYPTFLRAAAQLAESLPRAVFVLVGEGVDWSNGDLARLIAALGLSKRVRLLGRRDDVARLMAGFDVVCLTSAAEAFPNVIGEAMSCGVPCVGTAVGDVAELIGDSGEVVPPGDPAAVAAAAGRLLALEPGARRALGERARQRIIERFSIGEVARRYADLLRSVVEQQR